MSGLLEGIGERFRNGLRSSDNKRERLKVAQSELDSLGIERKEFSGELSGSKELMLVVLGKRKMNEEDVAEMVSLATERLVTVLSENGHMTEENKEAVQGDILETMESLLGQLVDDAEMVNQMDADDSDDDAPEGEALMSLRDEIKALSEKIDANNTVNDAYLDAVKQNGDVSKSIVGIADVLNDILPEVGNKLGDVDQRIKAIEIAMEGAPRRASTDNSTLVDDEEKKSLGGDKAAIKAFEEKWGFPPKVEDE